MLNNAEGDKGNGDINVDDDEVNTPRMQLRRGRTYAAVVQRMSQKDAIK